MPTTVPKEPVVAALAEVWATPRRAARRARRRRLGAPDVPARLERAGRRRPRHRHRVDAARRRRAGRRGRPRGAHRTSATTSAGSTRPGSWRSPTSRRPTCWPGSATDVARRARRARRDRRTRRGTPSGFTPAGQDTYGRFMRIRVFDCWLHEQDIRDAVGRPGGEDGPAAELALDEMAAGDGLRRRQEGRRAAGLAGALRADRAGRAARSTSRSAERAAVVDELSGPPTRHADDAGRRVRPPRRRPRRPGDRCATRSTIDGDPELGERIVANLAYTI